MLPKGTVFVVFCFLLRVVTALGGAAADTASFAIVAGEFGTNIGKVTVCKGYSSKDWFSFVMPKHAKMLSVYQCNVLLPKVTKVFSNFLLR